MKRIAVITGSRAEYFLLRPLLRLLQADTRFELLLLVTGSHLDSRHGNTHSDIEADGFSAAALIDLGLKEDSAKATAAATGRAMGKFSEIYSQLRPDLVLVLGDRYEIFGAAAAALLMSVPLAHIAGGDITEGAFDEALRHCISKMAQLHFPTTEASRRRLLSMGEAKENVHNVGSLSLDLIQETQWLGQAELEKLLGIPLAGQKFLVTVHPETLLPDSRPMLSALLEVLEKSYSETTLIFTLANADPQGQALNEMVAGFVAKRKNAVARASLGARAYLSLMRSADAVLGNSSSGIYEAPVLGIPVVNIGNRQKGRPLPETAVSAAANPTSIHDAIELALKKPRKPSELYGTPGVAMRILKVLAETRDFRALLRKEFRE